MSRYRENIHPDAFDEVRHIKVSKDDAPDAHIRKTAHYNDTKAQLEADYRNQEDNASRSTRDKLSHKLSGKDITGIDILNEEATSEYVGNLKFKPDKVRVEHGDLGVDSSLEEEEKCIKGTINGIEVLIFHPESKETSKIGGKEISQTEKAVFWERFEPLVSQRDKNLDDLNIRKYKRSERAIEKTKIAESERHAEYVLKLLNVDSADKKALIDKLKTLRLHEQHFFGSIGDRKVSIYHHSCDQDSTINGTILSTHDSKVLWKKIKPIWDRYVSVVVSKIEKEEDMFRRYNHWKQTPR